MADATIGALRVLLGLDTASFTTGTKEAEGALKSFAKNATTIAAGIGLEKVLEKTADGFAHLIKQSIETADQMGKMSQKIGIPVEELSSLTVASKLSDVGLEQLAKGVSRINTEMVKAAAGGIGPAASALQFLNISVKQLQGASPQKVLGLIADGFTQMSDGATKNAVAVALFGQRLGKDLIPLLNMGSKGFEEMARTAAALGLVISTQTAKQAEKFMDNMKLLGLSFQGVGNIVAAYFLPGMAKSSDAMVKWIVDGGVVTKIAEGIIRTIIFLGDNMKILGIVFGLIFGAQMITTLGNIALLFINLGKAMTVAAAATTLLAARWLLAIGPGLLLGAAVLAVSGNLDGFLVAVEKMSNEAMPSIKDGMTGFKNLLASLGFNIDSFTKELGLSKAAADEFNAALKKLLDGKKFDPNASAEAKKFSDELLKLGLKARELKGDFDNLAPGFVAAAIQLKLIKDTGDGFSGTLDTLNPKMIQLNNALLNVTAGQMTKDSLTSWEEYEKRITLVNQALQLNIETSGKAGITAEVAADQAAKAWAKVASTTADVLKGAAGAFSDLFLQFSKGSKEMFLIHKAFAISQAIISSYQAFTNALALTTLPPPFPQIAAAAALASGLAAVAKIVAEKPPAAAKGGSFMVPGGSMSVDTKLVPMMLSPGERVDVTPANQVGGTAGGVLNINPIRPKDFFTGDTVREMVLSIDQWMRNGGTGVRFAQR